MPASRDGLGPFYQDVIAVSPLEPWDAASAAYRLKILARTLPFPVSGARLVPSNNNDVWRLETGYLRALDAETRLGIQRPPVLAWLAADYPELFGAADLHRRLWLYALAYTIRQIIFWPPDRAEADDLEVTHPLHTLRRLIDAPLPLLAAGLP